MQELENKKAALELLLNETNDKLNDYKAQISMLQKDIDDYNKPPLTPMQVDNIYEAIESAVNDFDFEDSDNYDFEYELDYDGKVNTCGVNFQNSSDLVEEIVSKVTDLFKEADCPEDEPTADQLNKE